MKFRFLVCFVAAWKIKISFLDDGIESATDQINIAIKFPH